MKVLIEGHRYLLSNFENDQNPSQTLQFIQKEPSENDPTILNTISDGTTNEDLLEVLVDRLNFLQKKFPCRENAIVITHLETALLWLNKRTADRMKRGVEGKQIK